MCKKILAFVSLLLVLTLAAACCLSASSEGNILRVINAGRELLFETENVTVSGHAEFTLDGELFKTADILYQQDSTYSLWQLGLITPRPGREDKKSGFTIIANGEKIYIMEVMSPGLYSIAYDQPEKTLLRQSTASDLLFSMAAALADPIEGLLPEGSITETQGDGGTELQITLTRDSVPGLLTPLLNYAAQFTLRRFMGIDTDYISDQYTGAFGDYLTTTQAIIGTTTSYLLGDTSITLSLDETGRLGNIRGTVDLILSAKHEPERTVTVTFNAAFTDYGTTYVRTFDADTYGVAPAV